MAEDVKKLLLNDRWFPIPEHVKKHPEQMRCKKLLVTPKPSFHFAVIAAGRRSYKTERFLKRHFVCVTSTHKDERNFLGAPTRAQAKLIFWEDVKLLSPEQSVKDINETELRIDYINGSQLFVVGLKEYDRVHGTRWNRVGITEYQEVHPKIFAHTIQPILIDTNGEAVLEGRPWGKNHFYDDFLRANTTPERWASFQWKSEGILSAEQIKAAKEDLGLIDYLREYDASFESGSQKVYYGYTSTNHKKHLLKPELPIIVTCDFNAGEKPMSWNIGQQIGDETYWTNSFSYQYTNTITMCGILNDHFSLLSSYPKALRFYGDYSGVKNTSNSSFSDWEIIQDYFRNKCQVVETRLKPCLSIRDRIAATNGRLCNSNNVRRMFVDPEFCKALMKDWQYVEMKNNGVELDDSNAERTHSSDAVDYFADYEYSVRGGGVGRIITN